MVYRRLCCCPIYPHCCSSCSFAACFNRSRTDVSYVKKLDVLLPIAVGGGIAVEDVACGRTASSFNPPTLFTGSATCTLAIGGGELAGGGGVVVVTLFNTIFNPSIVCSAAHFEDETFEY